ncbi:MMPL family transporter [Salsipaludibacter albus]|uniref:MMPL family transporter n=1 Tax=Salsipaludibacter albus TaxID=2849650 RepID=UPI001EE4DB09|nr:MMPL family transporter [Salsipaludibacter albus]MBY5162621.1 MMPL family transporter [Salsipaludibacter albus]
MARTDRQRHPSVTRPQHPPTDPGPGPRGSATERLARAAARRPGRTLLLWLLVLAAAIVATATLLGDALTQDGEVTTELESQVAADLLDQVDAGAAGDGSDAPTEYVVVAAPDGSRVDDRSGSTRLDGLAGDLRATTDVVSVTGPADGVPGLVSAEGRHALLLVTLEESADVEPLLATLDAAEGDGWRIAPLGDASVGHQFDTLAEETLVRGEVLGLSIALVVLIVVFGAVVAALVPLGLAIAAVVAALGLASLVGLATDLSLFVVNMITMIGLAVGIDYSLFIVQRYREERRRGRETVDAIAVAGATATRAVVFSGVTVVIALLGMMLMPDTTFRSLGIGAIVVVATSVLGALTLLPAVLGLLGDRVDALSLPGRRRDREDAGATWNRIARAVMARPVVSVVAAGGLLLAMATPWLSIQLGSTGIQSLPEDADARFAQEVLADQFGDGLTTTSIVVRTGDADAADVQAATAALVASLEADPDHGEVTVATHPDVDGGGDLVVVETVDLLDPSSLLARDAVTEVRDVHVGDAFADVDAEVLVTGGAALDTDYVDLVQARTPWIFVFVLGLSFLLLLLAFRSVVVPLKAIAMNLLSVGATYGVLVAVFQWGWGADLLGFHTADVIEAWVPLFLFTVLFGLSMDYHVFLLSRIRERYDQTGDNTGSVAFGLSATGAIITGAALIMVAVFGGFATGDLAMFQQMGFGLAVAVVLDATIVRSVLVPATMALLGDRNWYLPRWLRWLPDLHVEGPGTTPDRTDRVAEPDAEPPVPVGAGTGHAR